MPARCLFAILSLMAAVAPAAAADVDRYLPDDSVVVAFVNVRQLLDAPVVQKHFLKEIKNALESEPFKPRNALMVLKIDPLKDIASVTLAVPSPLALNRGLLVVRGKFALDAVQDAANALASRDAEAITIHKQDDHRIYELKEPRSGRLVFICFLDKQTVAVAPAKEAVQEAISRHKGKKQPKLSKELQALLDKIDGKQAIWVAALAGEDLKMLQVNNPASRKIVEGLQTFQGGIAVDDGIRADFTLRTSDARTAAEVRKLLDGVKSLIGLAVMDNERFGSFPADLVSALKLGNDKEGVTLKGQMSDAEIEKSLKAKPKPADQE